jgi:Xaa-Pro aminopeptidase
MSLLREKADQAIGILADQGIDAWLTFVRETSGVRDPALDLLIGDQDLTWPSALIVTRSGRRIAIVGNLEKKAIERLGIFEAVLGYDHSIRELLREALTQIDPLRMAVNTSRNNVHADGLTHAMHGMLVETLAGTPYADRLVSAEAVISALRGRKTTEEQARIRKAVRITQEIFAETFAFMQAGMTESQVGQFMQDRARDRGAGLAWPAENCPAVNSGPDSPVGHSGPTDIRLQPGHVVHARERRAQRVRIGGGHQQPILLLAHQVGGAAYRAGHHG